MDILVILLLLFGIKKNANKNNLSESDFLKLDPGRVSTYHPLEEGELLRGDQNRANPNIRGYALGIFTDPTVYAQRYTQIIKPEKNSF